jgi:hypothetical protein
MNGLKGEENAESGGVGDFINPKCRHLITKGDEYPEFFLAYIRARELQLKVVNLNVRKGYPDQRNFLSP